MRGARARLYLDENVSAALARGLQRMGCDVVRALDQHPAGTADSVHIEEAATADQIVMSANDRSPR